jgi:hypothetical protein
MRKKVDMQARLMDVQFSLPPETAGEKRARLEQMNAELLALINQITAVQESSSAGELKKELTSAIKSLQGLQAKLSKDLH